MSAITVDKNGVLDVVAKLRALQGMTAAYESFSVSFGESRGPQAEVLSDAAARVAALARKMNYWARLSRASYTTPRHWAKSMPLLPRRFWPREACDHGVR